MLSHALALMVMDDGAPICMTLLSSLPFFFSSSCRLPAQCSLLPPYPAACYLLLTTSSISCLLPPTSYLLPATCHLPPATCCLLPPVSCLLPSYLLPATCYLLPAAPSDRSLFSVLSFLFPSCIVCSSFILVRSMLEART